MDFSSASNDYNRYTCLRDPVQIRDHCLDKHLTGSSFMELGSSLDSTPLIRKFSYSSIELI